MQILRQLTPEEVLFIGGETSTMYQHTAGLVLLDAADRPDFGFDSVRSHLARRIAEVPHFRWRLHEVALGLDLPYWVEDEEFDFDRHIRRIAVPSPGDHRALADLVSYLYARHLDRSRPLWEVWFIEGLEDGQYGLFSKIHHCIMDGEGANKLSQVINDLSPDGQRIPLDAAIADALPGARPTRLSESVTAARHLVAFPLRAAREIVTLAGQSVRTRLADGETARQRARTPATTFNRDIGKERGFVFGAIALDDVKAIKNHFDVTINDVLLAIIGGSLRRYLSADGNLPTESLRTSIAVSQRTDDEMFANKVTVVGTTLATDLDDPVERLRVVSQDAAWAKAEAKSGSDGFMELVAAFPPLAVGAMMTMTPPEMFSQAAGYNLIVSNVRGAPIPMYLGGARISAMYPMSIILRGSGVNVTFISYVDGIDIGITTAPALVPDPWRLIDGIAAELADLSARIPKRKRRAANAVR